MSQVQGVKAPSLATTHHWFVTTPFRPLQEEPRIRLPQDIKAHAKKWGTNATACGIPASHWVRLWAQPFPTSGAPNCPECAQVVATSAR